MTEKKYNIYLDNAATTKPYPEVVALNEKINNTYFANPSSTHGLGIESASLLKRSREAILKDFNLKNYKVIYTASSTEALNLAIKGYALKYQNRGKHLITSNVEHPSVLECFYQLRDLFGFEITILNVNEKGVVEPKDLMDAMRKDTILVSIMAVNNEVGSVNDLAALSKIVKQFPKCNFLSDTTQAVGKEKIDYSVLDMFTLSAHKIHGFKGAGALICKANLSFVPLISGGGQEDNLRSGTSSLVNALTLEKALSITLNNLNKEYARVRELHDYAYHEIEKLAGTHLNSLLEGNPYILNFSTKKKAAVVVEAFSNQGIYVSSVSACHSKNEASSYVIKAMYGNDEYARNTIRISFSNETTKEEIDIFIQELKNILENIR